MTDNDNKHTVITSTDITEEELDTMTVAKETGWDDCRPHYDTGMCSAHHSRLSYVADKDGGCYVYLDTCVFAAQCDNEIEAKGGVDAALARTRAKMAEEDAAEDAASAEAVASVSALLLKLHNSGDATFEHARYAITELTITDIARAVLDAASTLGNSEERAAFARMFVRAR